MGKVGHLNHRADLCLLAVAAICAVLFFSSVRRLWPLAPVDLHASHTRLERTARTFLNARGVSLRGYEATVEFRTDNTSLDYVERTGGISWARALLRSGFPLISYDVTFRKPGIADTSAVTLTGDNQVVGWRRMTRDDDPGTSLDLDTSRRMARWSLESDLHLVSADWRETSVSVRDGGDRRDFSFAFERRVVPVSAPGREWAADVPALRERVILRFAGDTLSYASRFIVLPSRALETAVRRDGSRRGLDLLGMTLLACAGFGAYLVFLLRLRDGTARLRRPLLWSGVVFLCTLGAAFLQPLIWDPLLPRPLSILQTVFSRVQGNLWSIIALMAVIAAADATERKELNASRGESLWRLTQGHIFDHTVARASGRGFLVGLICAGMMAGLVLTLEQLGIARIELQPRGFFITALNAASPSLWTLLYFLHIALLEELGYRYFAGSWLLARTRRPWVAIVIPAIIFGLTHTGLPFLPPADPFWARPLVMTLVGCIWGWAFLRYDTLTVIISHLTADLFIFNWPQIASGHPSVIATAVLVVCVPLIPALGLIPHYLHRVKEEEPDRSEPWPEAEKETEKNPGISDRDRI